MELITERSKRRTESGSGRHGIGILAARDRGIVADHGRICPQFLIGLVNPPDHRSTFSDIRSGRLLNCQELAFFPLSPIQE
jgi:hypothetical protein